MWLNPLDLVTLNEDIHNAHPCSFVDDGLKSL